MATVAVIDDDVAALDSFAVLLEIDGFQVSTFDDGTRFLADHHAIVADCVLLDIRMPKIDGLAVLQQFRADNFSTPVILMTASPKLLTQKRAQRLGAEMVLEKPIEEASLLSAVKMAIAAPSPQMAVGNNPYT